MKSQWRSPPPNSNPSHPERDANTPTHPQSKPSLTNISLPRPPLPTPFCRFTGQDPEPRAGLSSGHIPHSFSLPFTAFLQTHTNTGSAAVPSYTTFRRPEEVLEALKSSLGAERVQEVLSGQRRIVASCGSGMTAGVLWLGLQLLGVQSAAIYDEVRSIHSLSFSLSFPCISVW